MVEVVPFTEALKRLSDQAMKNAFDQTQCCDHKLNAIFALIYEQKITNELLRDQLEKLEEIYMGLH
jgi:IS4 transposase